MITNFFSFSYHENQLTSCQCSLEVGGDNKGENPRCRVLLRYFCRLKCWNVSEGCQDMAGSKREWLEVRSCLFHKYLCFIHFCLLLFLLLSCSAFIFHIRGWNPPSSNCVWHETVNLIFEAFIEMFQMCGQSLGLWAQLAPDTSMSLYPLFIQPPGLSTKVMHVMVLQSSFLIQLFIFLLQKMTSIVCHFLLRPVSKSPVP